MGSDSIEKHTEFNLPYPINFTLWLSTAPIGYGSIPSGIKIRQPLATCTRTRVAMGKPAWDSQCPHRRIHGVAASVCPGVTVTCRRSLMLGGRADLGGAGSALAAASLASKASSTLPWAGVVCVLGVFARFCASRVSSASAMINSCLRFSWWWLAVCWCANTSKPRLFFAAVLQQGVLRCRLDIHVLHLLSFKKTGYPAQVRQARFFAAPMT
jgi:hypothetical protein